MRPLPLQPLTAMRQGIAADVPLIHGGTKDEMPEAIGRRTTLQGNPVTEAQYPRIVTQLFGSKDAKRILAVYPAGVLWSGFSAYVNRRTGGVAP